MMGVYEICYPRMTKVNTDKDIMDFVKSILSTGIAGGSIDLYLNVLDENYDASKFVYRGSNSEDLVVKLFDLSLTSTITHISSVLGGFYQLADNGMRNAISGVEICIKPFEDGQTNITSKLVDFFHLLVDQYGLEQLKEPLRSKKPKFEVYTNPYLGVPIHTMIERNIWDYFEGNEDEG